MLEASIHKTSSESNSERQGASSTDRALSGCAITDKKDSLTVQRLQRREALTRFSHTDPNNPFTIDMTDGSTVSARRSPSSQASHGQDFEQYGNVAKGLVILKDLTPVNESAAESKLDTVHIKVSPDSNIDRATTKLNSWADDNIRHMRENPWPKQFESAQKFEMQQLEQFKHDIKDFKERVHRDGLLPKDVEKTLQQVDRLVSARGDHPLNYNDRLHIAEQVMRHAAVPTGIDQGGHNTCNVTTVESRAFTRNPGEAARLIVDIALTGQYETSAKYPQPDGKVAPLTIRINPEKHGESNFSISPGMRTHASEIFQVAAVNIYYAEQNVRHHMHLGYVQGEKSRTDPSDTGERIVDLRTGKPVVPEIRNPDLPDTAFARIMDAVTGTKHGKDMTIVHEGYRYGDANDLTVVHSISDLDKALQALKQEHKLPVIIKVNCLIEPFFMDSGMGKAGGSEGAHVVTIKDYDSVTGKVVIDNQWGSNADHDRKNPVDIKDLFLATQSSHDAIRTLQEMVDDDRKHGRFDPRKHMQQCRLANDEGEMSDVKYRKRVDSELSGTANRWGSISGQERNRESQELLAMTRNLSTEARLAKLSNGYRDGVFRQSVFENELIGLGIKIYASSKEAVANPVEFDRQKIAFHRALSELPAQDRLAISKQIETTTSTVKESK